MASFGKSVVRAFRRLTTAHGFLPIEVQGRFASFVRKECVDVFSYILVHDGRHGGADVTVELWVAPPDWADDRFDKLGVGYKILIGSEFNINDNFFAACETRLLTLLPLVPSLFSAIRYEFENSPFQTKRYQIYRLVRRAFDVMRREAAVPHL